jgi:glucose-6-phosphate isomerase
VLRFARARRASTTDVLLVGIGGSSRGAQALAACRPAKGLGRRGRPRLHVLDTVDPQRARDLLDVLPPRTTTLVATSKAGTTLETVAGLLVAERWLERAVGAGGARSRTAYVCGEEPNPLRARAEERGVATFAVPAGVGGRFSVLTAVGLLPAALLGIDPRAVLDGADAVASRARSSDPSANPALALALAHHAAVEARRDVVVALPYADALQPWALWWEQLVAESLGKRAGDGAYGVTPLPGVGPSDQHSLLQLLMEGPDRALVVFVEAADRARQALSVPRAPAALGAAGGRRLGALLAAEREATEMALAEAGRPSLTVRLPDSRPRSLGALLFLYEVAVLWWGRLAGVDPFGQPGVERTKVLTRAALSGSPSDAAQALARHRALPRHLSQ